MDNFTMDICQSKLPPLILKRQPFVVEAKLMQDGRIDVVDVNRVFNRRIPKFIRRPVAHASPDAATGKHYILVAAANGISPSCDAMRRSRTGRRNRIIDAFNFEKCGNTC